MKCALFDTLLTKIHLLIWGSVGQIKWLQPLKIVIKTLLKTNLDRNDVCLSTMYKFFTTLDKKGYKLLIANF